MSYMSTLRFWWDFTVFFKASFSCQQLLTADYNENQLIDNGCAMNYYFNLFVTAAIDRPRLLTAADSWHQLQQEW